MATQVATSASQLQWGFMKSRTCTTTSIAASPVVALPLAGYSKRDGDERTGAAGGEVPSPPGPLSLLGRGGRGVRETDSTSGEGSDHVVGEGLSRGHLR